jgi:hypothetical protein
MRIGTKKRKYYTPLAQAIAAAFTKEINPLV